MSPVQAERQMEFNITEAIISGVLFTLYIWVYIFRYKRKKITAPLLFSNTTHFTATGKTWRVRFSFIPTALRIIAILFLLIGFSRPRLGTEVIKTAREGIAIQMVVDRSSSMTQNIQYNGEESTRLEVVKKVFEKFILGDNDTLKGRPNDMIGLSSFAGFVDENAPLSLDHQSVVNLARTVQPAIRTEDGTMIGDAIYYAALRLVAVEQLLQKNTTKTANAPYSIKSKIMILLTDGEQTRGGFDPIEAAKFAKKHNIKVYTIAITDDQASPKSSSIFGSFFSNINREVDTRFLQTAAKITGGLFEKASSGEALENIYQKIDKMEKSHFDEQFTTYKEQFPLFIYAALFVLLFELLLRQVVFRKLP